MKTLYRRLRVGSTGNVCLGLTIVGRAGERYNKYALMDNRAVQKAKVRIVDETGKTLKTGSFRYG